MLRRTLSTGVVAVAVAVLPAFAWAETGSRNTSSSSERNQTSTSDELSDRTKRNEDVANAPSPKSRDRSLDGGGGAPSLPVIPVNPVPTPAAQ